jgi:hypothetical protein
MFETFVHSAENQLKDLEVIEELDPIVRLNDGHEVEKEHDDQLESDQKKSSTRGIPAGPSLFASRIFGSTGNQYLDGRGFQSVISKTSISLTSRSFEILRSHQNSVPFTRVSFM